MSSFHFFPCSSLEPFHGKRNFSCSPGRNPAILGKDVTALSCSPETLLLFHHQLFFFALYLLHSAAVFTFHSETQAVAFKLSLFTFHSKAGKIIKLSLSFLFFMHNATCLQRHDRSCKSCSTCGAAQRHSELLWKRQQGFVLKRLQRDIAELLFVSFPFINVSFVDRRMGRWRKTNP